MISRLAALALVTVSFMSAEVYELRTYYCLPGRLDALNARFKNHTLKLFEKHGMRRSVLCNLIFPQHKPAAVLYIDDRAFHFQGRFPTKEEITEFKPWHPNDANEECEARVDRLAKELVRTLADLASYAGSVTLPDGREYRLSVERIEK